MRRIFLSLTLSFSIVLLIGQEKKMSLNQCIETALANNIQVKQAGLQADAAEVNLRQAKHDMLPDLNGSFGFGFNQGRNVDPLTNSYINQQLSSSNLGLNSGIVLFNGMRLQNLIKQNSLNHKASLHDWQQSKENLTLNVILAYLQVLSNEDVLEINMAQVEVTKKQAERMGLLVNEGVAGNYLLADLKGQLANEQLAVVNTKNILQQAKLNICQLMNISYYSELALERNEAELAVTKYSTPSADVISSSMQNFSLIKANAFKIKSAEKGIQVSKSGFFPALRLGGNLFSSYSSLAETLTPTTVSEITTGSYVYSGTTQNPVFRQQQNFSSIKTGYGKQINNNLGTFFGLNMQIPLFNSFQTVNRVKLAKINLKNTKLESENAISLLKQNIEETYLNMTTAFERYYILMEQVKDFEESFRAAEIRFNTGVINSAEFLISKNNLDRTKINLAQAKYEYVFRTRLLDYYQGQK